MRSWRAGLVGASEVNIGPNGWHPHLHILLFVKGDSTLLAVERDLFGGF